MLSARFLGPSGYGLITYTASVVAFAAPLMYLGFTSVLVQELIAHPEKEGETLGTAIFSGLISGVLCIGEPVRSLLPQTGRGRRLSSARFTARYCCSRAGR